MKQHRRAFLKTGIASMAGYQPLFAQTAPAKRKLCIAGIGVGGMGLNNMTNIASQDIVALCDVGQRHAQIAFDKISQCQALGRFPRNARKTTGDRGRDDCHPGPHPRLRRPRRAQGRQACMCIGKKPLTHDICEARILTMAAAAADGCIAVMGNQHHSSTGIRLIAEWIRAGIIGDVTRVIGWCSLNYRPLG